MNGIDPPLPSVHRELLDLLVDGELPEAERRQLLLKLEETPGGWRACALAFLESQCLKQTCRAVAAEGTPAGARRGPEGQSVGRADLARPRSRLRWLFGGGLNAMAMAATFLVAIGLGWVLREGLRGDARPGPDTGQVVSIVPGGGVDRGMPGVTEADRESALGPAPRPWGTERLSLPGGASRRGGSISLPVTASDHVDASWYQSAPGAIPADAQVALERLGYQVRQERQLLPFPMQDGSRLVLPVDQVELRRASDPAY